MITYDTIVVAESELRELKKRYLRERGWSETCATPGAYWMWERDFTREDNAAMDWWRDHGMSPSRPVPWGKITATLSMAVGMTRQLEFSEEWEKGREEGDD